MIHFLPFLAIFDHFWLFFSPPWILGFLKHLCKEPDIYIYPLAMAPAKKSPLILNYFYFHSFFRRFHPLTLRWAEKPSLFIDINGFYWCSPSCGLFCSFCSFWGPTKPLCALWLLCGGPIMTPKGAKHPQISPPQLQNSGTLKNMNMLKNEAPQY